MNILVTGAGGFIGHNLVKRLKADGHTVIGADWKFPEFEPSPADTFFNVDLRYREEVESVFRAAGRFDEVYSLAANMGGMGFIENYRALIMRDSALISINVLEAARKYQARRYFFSSSACAYNTELQKDLDSPALSEDMAYPALPEAGYGWEKLFTELLSEYFREDFGLDHARRPLSQCLRPAVRHCVAGRPLNLGTALSAPGGAAGKRPRRRSAARSYWPNRAERWKSGETGCSSAVSCTSTTAWKARSASCEGIFRNLSISAAARW